MTISLPPHFEVILETRAKQRGITPAAMATELLKFQLGLTTEAEHEEWMRRLRALAVDTGHKVTDSAARHHALSSEGLYD